MRYDLTDFEWSVIEPLLPMDRRGPKPKNNRQIINGMFYVLRAGSPWRDLPERYGPYTTVYNRYNRWAKAACGRAISRLWPSARRIAGPTNCRGEPLRGMKGRPRCQRLVTAVLGRGDLRRRVQRR